MSGVPEDVALSEGWFRELTEYIDSHGLCGFDPFDIKQHPLIRIAQPFKWPRRGTTALCDILPVTSRRLLGVKKTENPKAHALVAVGSLRTYERTKAPADLARARQHLAWLLAYSTHGHIGLSWGYPFDVFGKGVDTRKGTPVGVVTSIAGEAFYLAYRTAGGSDYARAVCEIGDFFLHEIPRIKCSGGMYCFGYTPVDQRRVHNANLHVVEHLYRAYVISGETRYLEAATPALEFTLSRRRADGSWPYGEQTGDEPFEADLMGIVDHHHTGFVLRSLVAIDNQVPDPRLQEAISSGFVFYREELFTPEGMPINDFGRYPVDIHSCAEGILSPSVLASRMEDGLSVASRCLLWSFTNMRNPRNGLPYYRLYPWFTCRLLCTRWGLAWMYRALAEYLCAASQSMQFVRQNSIG